MKHVVMFSGGICSWAAARRVADRYGIADMTLLFADTLIEDEDLYRFLHEAAFDIGLPVTHIADGRTPWQVFHDVKFIGNSRIDPCSKILKRGQCDQWLEQNCDPTDTIVYLGFSWDETGRFKTTQARYAAKGWVAEAPLCWAPAWTRIEIDAALADTGIPRPRLYDMGFPHNNCGGFCIKAGQGAFALLLEKMPRRYMHHALEEEQFRFENGKDVSILRDRSGGVTKPLTLLALKEKIRLKQHDATDMGGCGCFSDEALDTGTGTE